MKKGEQNVAKDRPRMAKEKIESKKSTSLR